MAHRTTRRRSMSARRSRSRSRGRSSRLSRASSLTRSLARAMARARAAQASRSAAAYGYHTMNSFSSQMKQQQPQQPQQVKLTNVEIVDQSSALNVIVGFVSIAHSRGVFDLEESAKIWECIRQFQPAQSQSPKQSQSGAGTIEDLKNIAFP